MHDDIATLALALGSAFTAGVNLYATIAALGLAAALGAIQLPPDLQVLAHPAVIAVALLLYVVEFFADKVPYLDSVWDAVHTFIRVPAGAILAARAFGPVSSPRCSPAAESRSRRTPPRRRRGWPSTRARNRSAIGWPALPRTSRHCWRSG